MSAKRMTTVRVDISKVFRTFFVKFQDIDALSWPFWLKVVSKYTGKIWIAIDRLSIIWKSDLFDKIKRDSFQVVAVSVLL